MQDPGCGAGHGVWKCGWLSAGFLPGIRLQSQSYAARPRASASVHPLWCKIQKSAKGAGGNGKHKKCVCSDDRETVHKSYSSTRRAHPNMCRAWRWRRTIRNRCRRALRVLNTARLMEENTTLYKLKEMEYLEKICDKVGNITLGGGRSVLEQLAELVH